MANQDDRLDGRGSAGCTISTFSTSTVSSLQLVTQTQETLPEIGERLGHAARILNLNGAHAERGEGERHGDPVVVVRLNRCSVESVATAAAYNKAVGGLIGVASNTTKLGHQRCNSITLFHPEVRHVCERGGANTECGEDRGGWHGIRYRTHVQGKVTADHRRSKYGGAEGTADDYTAHCTNNVKKCGVSLIGVGEQIREPNRAGGDECRRSTVARARSVSLNRKLARLVGRGTNAKGSGIDAVRPHTKTLHNRRGHRDVGLRNRLALKVNRDRTVSVGARQQYRRHELATA